MPKYYPFCRLLLSCKQNGKSNAKYKNSCLITPYPKYLNIRIIYLNISLTFTYCLIFCLKYILYKILYCFLKNDSKYDIDLLVSGIIRLCKVLIDQIVLNIYKKCTYNKAHTFAVVYPICYGWKVVHSTMKLKTESKWKV